MESDAPVRCGVVEPHIRPADESDLGRINEIYNAVMVDSHVSFDVEPWDLEERSTWWERYASGRYDAYVAEAVRFETSYLENQGDGTFDIRALPIRTQFAPVFGVHSGDYDGDGHLDLLMVGNSYAPDLETGRADAFVGAFLRGDGTGRFSYVNYTKSGFFVDGDAKGLAEVATGGTTSLVLATQNSGPLKAFSSRSRHAVPLRPLDRYALLTFEDGSTRKEEFFYGSTYLSQSSRVLWIPAGVAKIIISGSNGNRRTVSIGNR